MLKIVRLALTRPYTFIVLAMLIVLIGPLSALRTPTDIFPDIRIPVISVVWNYAGLQPDDMAGRIVTYYERTLGTTVNDIEHIESQSFPATASSRSSSSRTSTFAPPQHRSPRFRRPC
jgi:multidrug efflux pump subunit AcrB